MEHIYDIFDDSQGLILAVIKKENPSEDFTKTANIEYGELGRESIKNWAWERERRFALDTPEHVMYSHQYFQKTANYIPADEQLVIRANINRVAKFMNVNLQTTTKQASLVYDTPLDVFPVVIPVDQLSTNMKTKFANYIYQDHLVFYPLGTTEQVKTANLMFPKGLDDELEDFRPMVAASIATKLDNEFLSPRVKEYLPIPKSAAMEQMEIRQDRFVTDPPNAYNALKKMLDLPEFPRSKFASILEELDQRSGAVSLCGNNFYRGKRYLAGIKDDTPENPFISIGGRDIPLQVFQKSASNLRDMYPTIDRVLDTPGNFRNFLDSVTQDDRNYILHSVIGARK